MASYCFNVKVCVPIRPMTIKKPEVHFMIKTLLIENECKTPYIFYQNIFYEKLDLRLFYFHVAN